MSKKFEISLTSKERYEDTFQLYKATKVESMETNFLN